MDDHIVEILVNVTNKWWTGVIPSTFLLPFKDVLIENITNMKKCRL